MSTLCERREAGAGAGPGPGPSGASAGGAAAPATEALQAMEEGLGGVAGECVICLEPLRRGSFKGGLGASSSSDGAPGGLPGGAPGDSVVVLGCCGQAIHLACLLKWLNSGGPGGCPHCRSEIPAVATAAATGRLMEPDPRGSDEARDHMRAVLMALSNARRQEARRERRERSQGGGRARTGMGLGVPAAPPTGMRAGLRQRCSVDRLFIGCMVLGFVIYTFYLI